jgi:serine/threonine protein kinase
VVELAKYDFEPLREDGGLALYRGRCRESQVELLVLAALGERPLPESRKRLENEYSLREDLDPAWATQPIRIATHEDRMVLLLHDPGGLPLDHLLRPQSSHSLKSLGLVAKEDPFTQPLDIALALRLAIRISATIGALHRRGIIHKDIKPSNVLVNIDNDQCWLTGFGIASRLPREHQVPAPPEFIAGTLAYMAPEQTGRMNRSIDSRSDLYALGVTLYEMLTGTLPFSATDPMEWVHCHIARQPVPPDQRSEAIPATVSAIVMKLLAKTAEERYQTAAGVQADLQRCLDHWEAVGLRGARSSRTRSHTSGALRTNGSSSNSTQLLEVLPNIALFPLGQHDTPDRLRIPEKLYGRDREIETLLASFDRVVVNGQPELVLISGYSGIGKSSVVNELHKVLIPPRGLFASGKFDQYKRNIPYWTLAQAFQSLVRTLLAKSEADLSKWREALQEALGPNGRLILDLVPELELVIGQQPAVPDLPPQDAKARFQRVFRRFVSVFARAEHPLALFVDDLQWLDADTLDFLEDLLTQPDVHHLMLIGAYRDNEVDSTHPLWRKLDAIRVAGAQIHEIVLAPLTRQDLGRLLADTLHGEPEWIAPLAHLVHAKTVGNPFFAIQFIAALAEESFLSFDHGAGSWSWDLNRIQAKGYTDNVADLMVGKLNRLASENQKALQEFACLGNITPISTLSIVHGISEEDLASDLWQAERLEFIVRSEGFYRFTHDRVQEAAYSLIPASARAEAHLLIGLPLMSDPVSLATMDVLTKLLPAAGFTDAKLNSLVVCRMVNLSLEHGCSDGSSFACVCLGMIAGPHFDNYKAGFRFGQLGYELVEKRRLKRFQARTYLNFGSHVMSWTKHVRACRDVVRRAFHAADETGDLVFAAASCSSLNANLLAAGDPLVDVQREAEHGLQFAEKAGFDLIKPELGLIRTLRGLKPRFGSFDDEQFDELRFERHLASHPVALPECFYWIRKLQARFLCWGLCVGRQCVTESAAVALDCSGHISSWRSTISTVP